MFKTGLVLRYQTPSPFAVLGLMDHLGLLGNIGHPLLEERGPDDVTG
jgi:hypothetical protein